MRLFSLCFLLIIQVSIGSAMAAECRKISEICVDGPGTRLINGESVYRDCWKYDAVYECVDPTAVDNCAPLTTAGCWQHAVPTCTETAFNGTCLNYQNTYRCADEQTPIPANVSFLDYVYTITKDTIENGCSAHEANPQCRLDLETCVEPGGTRNINGLDVTKDCWKWERNYTCATMTTSECTDLDADPMCQLTSTTCVDTFPTGDCSVFDKVYTCTEGSGGSQTVTSCSGKVTCMGSYCFDSGYAPDTDLTKSVAFMEMARQAGLYQDANFRFFSGESGRCRKKLFGSCCKTTSAGDSSNAGRYGQSMSQPSISGAVVGNTVKFMGSTYVHDALFSSSLIPDGMLDSLYGGTIGGAGTAPAFSYYGLTVTYDSVTGLSFGFDPTSLAISLAIRFAMEMLLCTMDQQEQLLALRKGSNLCAYVGTYCSSKFLGFCTERTEGWCCYNSKIAKLINVQGRAQLGKAFGSPASPDCSGFTDVELASLDLSQIDLTEFYREISPKLLDTVMAESVVKDNINCKTENGSYFGSTNPLCNKSASPGVIINSPVTLPQ